MIRHSKKGFSITDMSLGTIVIVALISLVAVLVIIKIASYIKSFG